MFRKAVSTIEGYIRAASCFVLWLLTYDTYRVKADSLFSYQPPINLVAVCILLPASYVLSPRWFHKVSGRYLPRVMFPLIGRKVNVFLIRSFVFGIYKSLGAYPLTELRISPSSSSSHGMNVSWQYRHPVALAHVGTGQAKKTASLGFYETISSLFEKMVENLPRSLKWLCKSIG